MARKDVDHQTRKMFRPDQGNMFEKSYEEELEERRKQKVECLGMTFENDDARREHFLGILREKLKDPEFRKIEGFPIGEDEDILALSDPPYYTACPNPFIVDFIRHYAEPYNPIEAYRRDPFAADVSEGKNDPIYNVHSYHTKVPHKAIMRYILHYTEPGDVVLDGFCGTGMTGVASQLCSDEAVVKSLDYKVDGEGIIYQQEMDENCKMTWKPFSKLGARRAILSDLSPAATFIAYNYNAPLDVTAFDKEARRILAEIENECGWMYETLHIDGKTKGKINYIVWSDVFVCSECTCEVVFWEAAIDEKKGAVNDNFPCPHCAAHLSKRGMDRAWIYKYRRGEKNSVKLAKQIPVVIDYGVGIKRFRKKPDEDDLNLIHKIDDMDIPYWYPENMIEKGDKTSDPHRMGVKFVDDFFTRRNLYYISAFASRIQSSRFLSLLTAVTSDISKMARVKVGYYFKGGGGPFIPGLTGTLYIPSLSVEKRVDFSIRNRVKTFARAFGQNTVNGYLVNTGSTSHFEYLADNSVDYLFLDPPFGSNIMYSELNLLWESWIKIKTNAKLEAIENKTQRKGLREYQQIMTKCFQEYYRVLKPGRWMTVEFHNSKNSVWNAIQEALWIAGFVIADVRTLDKKQGSFNQVTQAGAVKQDIIISCYKLNGGLEDRFKLTAGTGDGVWDFIRTHLKQLPVFVSKDGQAEVIAERQNYLLFDRMVAFHVQRGVTVPLSSAEFYAGLEQRFPPRDGMYFLPDQAAEYDRKRMTVKELLQLDLFVKDESSAIQWLRQQFTRKPQAFQETQPNFLKQMAGWQKNEKVLELKELLEQNFLFYDGTGEVPSQIHSYLSTNYKELRKLPKYDPLLQSKAKDRWYVPDPNKAGDLEKLRERALMKEFHEYLESKQKRLKVFRLEAVRAGFKKAWQEKDYSTIIEVAKKIKDEVLQEDPKLLMFYDQALTRSEQT